MFGIFWAIILIQINHHNWNYFLSNCCYRFALQEVVGSGNLAFPAPALVAPHTFLRGQQLKVQNTKYEVHWKYAFSIYTFIPLLIWNGACLFLYYMTKDRMAFGWLVVQCTRNFHAGTFPTDNNDCRLSSNEGIILLLIRLSEEFTFGPLILSSIRNQSYDEHTTKWYQDIFLKSYCETPGGQKSANFVDPLYSDVLFWPHPTLPYC